MEKYELLYIIPAKYTEAEIKGLTDKLAGIVSGAGGKISETHNLGRRRLAYPLKRVRNGHYVLVYFEAEAAAVAKLNETLRLSADILRHLITARDPYLKTVPVLTESEEGRFERREEPLRAPAPAPRPQPQPAKERMTMEELDKKLDEILTEDVL